MSGPRKKPWWETLFDQKYLRTYIDLIPPELAEQQVSELVRLLKLKKKSKVLDLACGHGRIALALLRRGFHVTGLDYSKHFIELAKRQATKEKLRGDFFRGDMRRMQFENRFDFIINLFTSFGYFDDEQNNALVLRNIARALIPGGLFLIDLNNTIRSISLHAARKGATSRNGWLVSRWSELLSNGLRLSVRDAFNPETMRWKTTRAWRENGKSMSYTTDVRMYLLTELKKLMLENGLKPEKTFGALDGSPFTFHAPRMIMLASKS